MVLKFKLTTEIAGQHLDTSVSIQEIANVFMMKPE